MANSDNPVVGAAFEEIARRALATHGLSLAKNFSVPVGAGRNRREHKFDLGSETPPVLVECKAHTWTTGGNSPSAKLTVWNEAMHYFQCAPPRYRKILFVLRDERQGETLTEHYLRRHGHLVPDGVEIWEYDRVSGKAVVKRESKGEAAAG